MTQKVPAGVPTADTVSFRVDIAEMDPAFGKSQVTASGSPGEISTPAETAGSVPRAGRRTPYGGHKRRGPVGLKAGCVGQSSIFDSRLARGHR